MKIEAGKYYRTRCGQKAIIYAVDVEGNQPIHGAILGDDGWSVADWGFEGFHPVSDHNLVDEWPTKLRAFVSRRDGRITFSPEHIGNRGQLWERAPWLDEP